MVDRHRHVRRAVGVGRVRDPHLVLARLRDVRDELRGLLAVARVAVVPVAEPDVGPDAGADSGEPDPLRLLVVHGDPVERLRVDPAGAGQVFEHLPVGEQPLAELVVIDGLHVHTVVDGERGGGRGGLAEDHEHRLHADRPVGDVRAGQAHRHEEVRALALLRDDRQVTDPVRPAGRHLHVSLVPRVPRGIDVALRVVRVHRVRAQADRILRLALPTAIRLGHDVFADHPPRLAHVKLERPIPRIDKLILRQPPLIHLRA